MKLPITLITITSNQKPIANNKDLFQEVLTVTPPQPIKDFSKVRNKAIKQATQPWILFLDSDEKLSPELVNWLQLVDWDNEKTNGYYIKRIDFFHNKPLQYGEVRNVYKLRLAKKDKYHFERPIHEVGRVEGKIQYTNESIYHYSHNSIESFYKKIVKYASIDATNRVKEGQQFNSPRQQAGSLVMITYPIGKFIVNYFFKLGFLDGYRGLIYAILMSMHSLIVRVKMYELKMSKSK